MTKLYKKIKDLHIAAFSNTSYPWYRLAFMLGWCSSQAYRLEIVQRSIVRFSITQRQ